MLEKPDLPDQLIIECLRAEYGLRVARVDFLPLGVDVDAAVYRAVTADGTGFFVKLRRGPVADIAVTLPYFLARQGFRHIIAPLETQSGGLRAALPPYNVVLYPFVAGKDGYERSLSERQWPEFGALVGGIHALALPPALVERIPREDFSPHWREMAHGFLAQAEEGRFDEPVAARLAAFMRLKRVEIGHMLGRGEALAQALRADPPPFVLCHADLHAGNLLIAGAGAFYLVDWDAPLLAPKEKDLSLVGGCAAWGAERDVRLFYQGYGAAEINPMALAYYRYERIIMDIAAFCEQLFLSDAGGPDREQACGYFTGQFMAGHEVDLALRTDK